MKTITIRLPDVEAAMLVEVRKRTQPLRIFKIYWGFRCGKHTESYILVGSFELAVLFLTPLPSLGLISKYITGFSGEGASVIAWLCSKFLRTLQVQFLLTIQAPIAFLSLA